MRTLYLRNVPDDVAARLEEIASAEDLSLNALAVRDLTDVARRSCNARLFDGLPDVASALRRLVRRGALPQEHAEARLLRWTSLAARRHDARPLLPRVWALRETDCARRDVRHLPKRRSARSSRRIAGLPVHPASRATCA